MYTGGPPAPNWKLMPINDRIQTLHLSFAQQHLWLLTQMGGASAAYHLSMGLRLSGELNVRALRAALDRIVFRHDALRTTFRRLEDDAVQHIAPADSGFSRQEHDLQNDRRRCPLGDGRNESTPIPRCCCAFGFRIRSSASIDKKRCDGRIYEFKRI